MALLPIVHVNPCEREGIDLIFLLCGIDPSTKKSPASETEAATGAKHVESARFFQEVRIRRQRS